MSIFFYTASGKSFIFVILELIFLNFVIAILVDKTRGTPKKFLLILGLIINLGVLIKYKYLFFLINIFLPSLSSKVPPAYLPLALSFFTFHTISYLIDTYRQTIKAEKKITNLALYLLLFPHLVAGPIIRFNEISEQINFRGISLSEFSLGINCFIIGLSKKILIADTLGYAVDNIFGIPPSNITTETAWLGIICFTLQLYFDFSGYTDMAIGLASMFGFKFPENFNYPYISSSIREFWTRWHITLSNWLRDYIYYPLALKWAKGSKIKLYISLFITFVLIGLWHGANWTYIIFGGIQGIALIIESIKNGNLFNRIPRVLRHVYFLLVMVVSWVFFRSESVGYAIEFLKRLFLDFTTPKLEFRPFSFFINNEILLAILIGMIVLTSLLQRLLGKIDAFKFFKIKVFQFTSQIIKFLYFLALLIASMIYIAGQTFNPFIYFKF